MKTNTLYLSIVGLLLLMVAIATGFRPLSVGSDTPLYNSLYTELLNGVEQSTKFEFIFDAVAKLFSYLLLDFGVFASFISLLNIALISMLLSRFNVYLDRAAMDARVFIFCFIFLLFSPFFLSFQINVIRQGVSCFSILLAYSLRLNNSYRFLFWWALIFSIGFHSTGFMYAMLLLGTFLSHGAVRNISIAGAFFYSFGGSEYLLKIVSDQIGFNILAVINDYGVFEEYNTGVRLDFVAFSLGLGFFSEMAISYGLLGCIRYKFRNILGIYWLMLIPFYIFGFGAFSDRYLLNSWVFISIFLGILFSFLKYKNIISPSAGVSLLFFACVGYMFVVQGGI